MGRPKSIQVGSDLKLSLWPVPSKNGFSPGLAYSGLDRALTHRGKPSSKWASSPELFGDLYLQIGR